MFLVGWVRIKMEAHFCDRCGKRIEGRWWKWVFDINLGIGDKQIELCKACAKEFRIWMKNTSKFKKRN